MGVLCDHTERVIYVICEAGSPYSYYAYIVVGWQSSASSSNLWVDFPLVCKFRLL